MIEESDSLRQQVMINQFTMTTGCTVEQARTLLQNTRWEFEMALSSFFQEATIQSPNTQFRYNMNAAPGQKHVNAPSNTPATPPSFPDALLALQKLTASDWTSTPPQQQPLGGIGGNNGGVQQQQQQHNPFALSHQALQHQQPKVLCCCNPPSQANERFMNCDFACSDDYMYGGSKMMVEATVPQLQPDPQIRSGNLNYTLFSHENNTPPANIDARY